MQYLKPSFKLVMNPRLLEFNLRFLLILRKGVDLFLHIEFYESCNLDEFVYCLNTIEKMFGFYYVFNERNVKLGYKNLKRKSF